MLISHTISIALQDVICSTRISESTSFRLIHSPQFKDYEFLRNLFIHVALGIHKPETKLCLKSLIRIEQSTRYFWKSGVGVSGTERHIVWNLGSRVYVGAERGTFHR
jgi:hypothetical protein